MGDRLQQLHHVDLARQRRQVATDLLVVDGPGRDALDHQSLAEDLRRQVAPPLGCPARKEALGAQGHAGSQQVTGGGRHHAIRVYQSLRRAHDG
jgi:hypothetical protein